MLERINDQLEAALALADEADVPHVAATIAYAIEQVAASRRAVLGAPDEEE